MKNQMISDFNIEGLASSAPALEVLDVMLYIFGFIYLGTVLSVIYTIRLKTLEGLKSWLLNTEQEINPVRRNNKKIFFILRVEYADNIKISFVFNLIDL